ncbi:unnamed protein product [Boreogadus saida]
MIVICLGMFIDSATAVQVNLKPKMVSMGTQTFTPLTSPDPTDGEDDLSVISDASWVPGDQMSEEDEEVLCEEPTPTCDPHLNGIDKFIVCQEELMALFAICPACCEKSDSRIVQQEGTFVKIEQHKRIQAACIKSWMLSEACHICWSWAELLD